MKKTLFLLITILTISFIGCSDDDDSEYKDAIIGTWELTQIEFGGGWTSMPRRTYATFNSDGTYNGRGYFGNGSGTYKISGNTIICYIEGEGYVRYDIIELNSNSCTLNMKISSEEFKIKCIKH